MAVFLFYRLYLKQRGSKQYNLKNLKRTILLLLITARRITNLVSNSLKIILIFKQRALNENYIKYLF